ncbi:MAG: hypothetical protein CME32_09270, partial [Gimesia sp.]|nr:hypothetical protein [Gimesia sp.]
YLRKQTPKSYCAVRKPGILALRNSRRTEVQTHAQADIATDRHTGNILVHDEETHVAVAFVSATLTNR